MFNQVKAPSTTFAKYFIAREWALTNAREHCMPYQGWQIVRKGERFAVAIFSKNTGAIQGYAH